MIKKGEKVICIRTDYINKDGNPDELPFQIGKDYIVSHFGNLSVHIEGWAFSKGDNIYLRKFEDYFITLAEYRDKRIDEILNEE